MASNRQQRRMAAHDIRRADDSEPHDQQLLRDWTGGDQNAGHCFVRRHEQAVRSYIARRTRDDVDDLVQQTFLACMLSGSRYEGSGSVRAFLIGIARNQLLSAWRQRRKLLKHSSEWSAELDDRSDGDRNDHAEAYDAFITGAVAMLPRDLHATIKLIYWEGLTREATAQETNVSPGTVASRVRLAKHRLRRWAGHSRRMA